MTTRLTRNQILNAIDLSMAEQNRGLCGAFIDNTFKTHDFIRATGGKQWRDEGGASGYFWAPGALNPQRLMFLAFMLTWQEDIERNKR